MFETSVTHDPTSWMKTVSFSFSFSTFISQDLYNVENDIYKVECNKLDGKSSRVSYHTIFVLLSWIELDGIG